jgi:hypothetical protein
MKKTKIYSGCYLINDDGGIWIARKNGNWWTAYDAERDIDCTTLNNWAISFRTLKALLKYANNPTSKAVI